MDAEVGVFDELGLTPFARLCVVVGFDMAIDCIFVSLRSTRFQNVRTYRHGL